MQAFAYMKTKIFLQSEGRTGAMGRGCQAIHAVNGNKKGLRNNLRSLDVNRYVVALLPYAIK